MLGAFIELTYLFYDRRKVRVWEETVMAVDFIVCRYWRNRLCSRVLLRVCWTWIHGADIKYGRFYPTVAALLEMSLKATILLGTLKKKTSTKFSHTEVLCEILRDELAAHGVKSELIRLAQYRIVPGTKSNMGKGDDWPKILKKVLAADIIIFATPIWWGLQSSLIQRIVERMDALNDELLETGKSELANKVGGIVITGAEDGAQHVIGNLCSFMSWNGLTVPPACSLSYLGGYPKTKNGLLKFFREQKSTMSMARTMARNMAFYAQLLKNNPLPNKKDAGIRKNIAAGTVGMLGNAA